MQPRKVPLVHVDNYSHGDNLHRFFATVRILIGILLDDTPDIIVKVLGWHHRENSQSSAAGSCERESRVQLEHVWLPLGHILDPRIVHYVLLDVGL